MDTQLSVRGLVLKCLSVGEADRSLVILTSEGQLLDAWARGARRSRSRLISSTQWLSLSDFHLYAVNGRLSVDQAERIEAFQAVTTDVERLTLAAYLGDVAMDLARAEIPDPVLPRLLLHALVALGRPDRDPVIIAHAAAFRMTACSGFCPSLDRCGVCGDIVDSQAWFSHGRAAVLCGKASCRRDAAASEPLHPGLLQCLRHILGATEESLFSFRLSEPVARDFVALATRFVEERMEHRYERLSLLESFQSFGGGASPRKDASASRTSEPDDRDCGRQSSGNSDR